MPLTSKILMAILLVAACAGALLVIARAAQRSEALARWEQRVFDRLGRWLAPRFVAVCNDVSALGSSTLVGVFGSVLAVALWATGDATDGWLVAASTIGPGVLGRGFKRLSNRARPADAAAVFFGSSMPSNHTVMATALWGTAALVAGGPGLPAWAAGAAAIAAVAVAAAVGATRVLLRVHYVSDVLAGWALGAAWVAAVAVVRAG